MSEQHQRKMSWWPQLCRWLWKYPLPFLFLTIIINIVINIGSTWLIAPASTNAIPDTSFIGRLIGWIGTHWLFSLLLSMISIALLLVTWRGSHWSASMSSVHDQAHPDVQHRKHILGRLRLRYEQMLAQSLEGVVQIELGLASRPNAIQNAISLSLRLPQQPEQVLPAYTSIVDAYKQAQQELLILGEPGAGKSTLLLQLAYHLVTQAEQDTIQPLPVLLPLSFWAEWAEKRPRLQDWLIEQLASLYNIPRQLSQDWVQEDLILPLLDGLDEMEESARPACIKAINIYHREHLGPLVVCSRTNEYDVAGTHERLILHAAVVVQPLSKEQVDTHLASIGKPLASLRLALEKNTVLAELATTPLMLQILMLTYHGIPVRQLSHRDTALQQQVWDDYVQRMVTRKGNTRRYPLNRTVIWLRNLTQLVGDDNKPFNIFSLHEGDDPTAYNILYKLSIWPIDGLISGLLVGLSTWLVANHAIGLTAGLHAGVFIGVLTSVLVKLHNVIGSIGAEKSARRWYKSPFSQLYPVVMTISNIEAKLIEMLMFIMILPFLPFYSRSSSNRGCFIWVVGNGLIYGQFAGVIAGLVVMHVAGLISGLVSWLFAFLIVGLLQFPAFILYENLCYYILRFWLAICGILPWRVVPFLEDATARNLLQRIGDDYSFIHRLLLDYFADVEIAPTTPSPRSHLEQ